MGSTFIFGHWAKAVLRPRCVCPGEKANEGINQLFWEVIEDDHIQLKDQSRIMVTKTQNLPIILEITFLKRIYVFGTG